MKRLLVSVREPGLVRVALIDGEHLLEYQVEEDVEKTLHGSIYLAKVVNIEPGIQAAFLDIGEERSAFVHVSDIHHAYAGARGIPVERFHEKPPDTQQKPLIQNILRKGQKLLVQVTKEAIGHKGPSVTTFVSLPGRYLVLMAGMSRSGISKKIENPEQRERLRKIADTLDPGKNLGVIVRTAGVDQAQADLERDLRYLKQAWQDVMKNLKSAKTVGLLSEESDVAIRAVRDLFRPDIREIVTDGAEVADQLRQFIERVMPNEAHRVRHYTGSAPLFVHHRVEKGIEDIYDRKVPLRSGGSLVIDETEALVAIDVNSGRYRAEEDLERTALQTNMEACEEIARQLRLRDIGGVVICDFIDMTDNKNRRKVEAELRNQLKHDRAKTWFSRMSRFCIIEMTRQRLRPSKDRVSRESCPQCGGRGTVRSLKSLTSTILGEVRRGMELRRTEEVVIAAGDELLEYLANEKRDGLHELELDSGKRIQLRLGKGYSPGQYHIDFLPN